MKQETSASLDELKKETRPFWLAGLILIMILASTLLILKPKLSEIFSQQRKLKREKERLARLTQKLAALEGLNEYGLSAKTEWALKILPASKDVPRALSGLRTLSEPEDLILTDIKVQPGHISNGEPEGKGTQAKGAPSLDFQIAAYGSLENLANFLKKVNSVAPLMRVVEVSFSKGGDEIESEIQLKAYYSPLPQSLTALEQPLPSITREENEVYERLSEIEILESESLLQPIEIGREDPFNL
jgi:Tfp pilus assembly protein PilO